MPWASGLRRCWQHGSVTRGFGDTCLCRADHEHVSRTYAISPAVNVTRPPRSPRSLYATEGKQNDNDDKQQTEPTTRVVSPTAAVSPCRQSADQEEDQNDQQDRTKHNSTLDIRLCLPTNQGGNV